MKKRIIAGAVVGLFTLSTISVNAQGINSANYYVHPHNNDGSQPNEGERKHHHHHHHENKQLLEKHKKEVVSYLSNYLKQPEANVNKAIEQHKLGMKKLIFVCVVAKLSNKPIENIIAQKEKTKSFKELLSNNNIKHEQFFGEMKKVHRDLFNQIEPEQNKN